MDRQAFETLYRRYERALYNLVYRWVWREDEAMDLVQEAFLRFWAKRTTVETGKAKAYLFRTALNLAAKRHRSLKIWRWIGLEADGHPPVNTNPEGQLLAREREAHAARALEALPDKYRRVLLLYRFGDMSYREIGDLLGIAEGTVASRKHKAEALLKKAWRRNW